MPNGLEIRLAVEEILDYPSSPYGFEQPSQQALQFERALEKSVKKGEYPEVIITRCIGWLEKHAAEFTPRALDIFAHALLHAQRAKFAHDLLEPVVTTGGRLAHDLDLQCIYAGALFSLKDRATLKTHLDWFFSEEGPAPEFFTGTAREVHGKLYYLAQLAGKADLPERLKMPAAPLADEGHWARRSALGKRLRMPVL